MSNSTDTNNGGSGGGGDAGAVGPTPGPWHAQDMPGGWFITSGEVAICKTYAPNQALMHYRGAPNGEANAHLIAQAPAFLAACTPARLDALSSVLAHYSDPDARRERMILVQMLVDLRAAVAGAGGGRTP